jgi:uncharacterized protein YkwD
MKGLLLSVFFMLLFQNSNQYLDEISAYNKDSYYKQKAYSENDWKRFYDSSIPNTILDLNHLDLHLLNAALFYSTNKLRSSKGLKELEFSGPLRDAAVVHTYEMVKRNFFDHYNRKNRKLYSPANRFELFEVRANATAENVALNYLNPGSPKTYIQIADIVVDALFHSKEHRLNMLSKNYSKLGCAIYFEQKPKNGVWYFKATQDFSSGN